MGGGGGGPRGKSLVLAGRNERRSSGSNVTRRTTADIEAAFGICDVQKINAAMEELVKAALPDSHPPSHLTPAVPSGDERTRQGDFDGAPWGFATKHR